jgi:MraZ protein
VQLPERLRQYGSLDGEVVLIGVGTHVEIWNSTAWSAHLEQVLQHAEEDAEALALLPG